MIELILFISLSDFLVSFKQPALTRPVPGMNNIRGEFRQLSN